MRWDKWRNLSCYSNKIEWVCLTKRPYDHWLTNKACFSAITVTNISESFTHKMAAKTSWHRYGTKLRHCHPIVSYEANLYVAKQSRDHSSCNCTPLCSDVPALSSSCCLFDVFQTSENDDDDSAHRSNSGRGLILSKCQNTETKWSETQQPGRNLHEPIETRN